MRVSKIQRLEIEHLTGNEFNTNTLAIFQKYTSQLWHYDYSQSGILTNSYFFSISKEEKEKNQLFDNLMRTTDRLIQCNDISLEAILSISNRIGKENNIMALSIEEKKDIYHHYRKKQTSNFKEPKQQILKYLETKKDQDYYNIIDSVLKHSKPLLAKKVVRQVLNEISQIKKVIFGSEDNVKHVSFKLLRQVGKGEIIKLDQLHQVLMEGYDLTHVLEYINNEKQIRKNIAILASNNLKPDSINEYYSNLQLLNEKAEHQRAASRQLPR